MRQEASEHEQPGNGDRHADDAPESSTAPGEAFRHALSELAELKEYARQYLEARRDAIKLSIRNGVIWGILGLLALLTGVAVIVTAAALLVSGAAQVIAEGLGGRMWAGNLIAGGGVLIVVGLAAWLFVRQIFKASRTRAMGRYEQRLREQQIVFGHNARDRSGEQRRG